MSYLNEQEVVCSHCKHPNNAEVWSSINVQEDPELKDVLLGGELNMIECEACKKIFYAEQFLLYHDPANELLAFVYPYEYRSEREAWEGKTRIDMAQAQFSYEPVSLFGLDELVHLVERDEEAAIQGEIVSLLAQDHGFSVRKLKPSLARKQKFPVVLPYHNDVQLSPRDAVLSALGEIMKINDRLSIYAEARQLIASNPMAAYEFF